MRAIRSLPKFYMKKELSASESLTQVETDRIVEMAWEDRTPFDAIKVQFDVDEKKVIDIMRREMKASSFRMWRARVQGRSTKHAALRTEGVDRFKSRQQKTIAMNKIFKK
jgi:uncharacterized protein (TIGR03643 family)